ncbi:exopolyphosphatase/guanosine-5'-triphosphate,3'-diphosphate pyrophosphatase [Pontibacter ummariensis]|uniref:Exopolyphosphatase / guanosine-5'-triphosphate,3'-diphosphate pyrophosphatase n=1 Tax=Pontibacter ummariensis TaxID=1610492 RepID=A0A239B0J8_9BACT|nr:phosphatase [Pontibacter ummariensis]PRY16232.1 exopolyphosphatase/guanosine-5'-triphosphate,3'-diphosphate pyrophosphatase [Pontibacter ummariensis]SNS01515.1 exopolyphosphatase / guanosine-5'-triphosphate,3'-diphosphate pyrophosphatase [Pontibacter ummariensis]
MNRLALIDMGTNTFHLLISEVNEQGQLQQLYKTTVPVRLGQGGISNGAIAPEAYERAIGTLREFRKTIDAYDVETVRAMATSMVRNASNGDEFVKDIFKQTDILVEVISGDREAEYIYYGVRAAGVLDQSTSLIMDIGGGSVEFILCNEQEIFWKRSFELGAQRLMDKFFQQDPIAPENVEAEKNYLREKLQPLSEAVVNYQPTNLVGSSGTFDTLCDIDALRRGDTSRTVSDPIASALAVEDFYQVHHELLRKNHEERLAIPGMLEMRVDMIVLASIAVDFVLQEYRLQEIRVSAYALKEGVLHQAFAGL